MQVIMQLHTCTIVECWLQHRASGLTWMMKHENAAKPVLAVTLYVSISMISPNETANTLPTVHGVP